MFSLNFLQKVISTKCHKVKTHSNQKNWYPYLQSINIVLNLRSCCRSCCGCCRCCGFRSYVESLKIKNQMILTEGYHDFQKVSNLPANSRLMLHFVHEQHKAWAGPGPLNCPLKKFPIWLANMLSVQSDFGTRSDYFIG